ncbi:hypothetical protein ACFL6N_01265 [Thermodesulfobacteriota bacterium]
MSKFAQISAKIPVNKFYPPRLEASQGLFRKGLVEDVLLKNGRTKKVIVIEAQAGQGKTTLSLQYLEACDLPYGWYQVGAEDSDPVLLLNALMTCLSKSLPDFAVPLLEEMLASGEIKTQELFHLANLLLTDLEKGSRFSSLAMELARKHGAANFKSRSLTDTGL